MKLKKIAAISMARNDDFFVEKWIDYYGKTLGEQHLYLILDGTDQVLPVKNDKINLIIQPHVPMTRTHGDRYRSRLVSAIAENLFQEKQYDIVIAHDIDEILIADPSTGLSLPEYLSSKEPIVSLSGLGLDVGQHMEKEKKIDLSIPFLQQRSFAHVSARYTKPIVAFQPLTWGSGFHRVKGRNFKIDPNLFVLHFGMVDYELCKKRISDTELISSGWENHFKRRFGLFELLLKQKPRDGDRFFPAARCRQRIFRPVYAINKPGMLRDKPVVIIPERFRSIV